MNIFLAYLLVVYTSNWTWTAPQEYPTAEACDSVAKALREGFNLKPRAFHAVTACIPTFHMVQKPDKSTSTPFDY